MKRRPVRRFARTWLACLAAVVAVAGCATVAPTLRSHHFTLELPADWQLVEAGSGGATPTRVRAPAHAGAPEVDVRVYAWSVAEPPADTAADAHARLAAIDSGIAAAHADDAEPCPERANGFFVFGKQARALHLLTARGEHIVITAGESRGSLVAMTATIAPGTAGCAGVAALDAAIERLAASLITGADLSRPVPRPIDVIDTNGRIQHQLPAADPGPRP